MRGQTAGYAVHSGSPFNARLILRSCPTTWPSNSTGRWDAPRLGYPGGAVRSIVEDRLHLRRIPLDAPIPSPFRTIDTENRRVILAHEINCEMVRTLRAALHPLEKK